MKQVIVSAFKRYNANTRDARVGDCVKRALSVAYSMDYDAVSRELNQIKRDKHADAFNATPVWSEFVRRRGDEVVGRDRRKFTAAEFCEQHPTGVYLIETGDPKNVYPSHLAAVVDGTLYDSWDSQSWLVYAYGKVHAGVSDVYEFSYLDVYDDIIEFVEQYLSQLNPKNPDSMKISIQDTFGVDTYTFEIRLRCKFGQLPKYAEWDSGQSIFYRFTVKLSPRLSLEKNVENIKKKIKGKIYDWSYNIRKDILDAEASESIDTHPEFSRWGNRKQLMMLPEWSRPYVIYIEVKSDYHVKEWEDDKYEVYMEALPDDPYIDTRGDRVEFRSDTLRNLKDEMEDYRKNFYRFGYDY